MCGFATQLQNSGCAALDLPELSSTFIATLDECFKAWFDHNLELALLQDEVPQMKSIAKMREWEAGRHTWRQMADATKRDALFRLCDLSTRTGRLTVFHSPSRKSAMQGLVAGDERAIAYLCDRILYTKQGGTRNGQARIPEAVTNTGFGLSAHLIPSMGVQAMAATRAAIQSLGITVRYSGVPHLVAKPPRGVALAAHTDGPRPKSMIEYLESVHLPSATNLDWARRWGVQTLIHHSGGRADGATYAIANLTPHKYYVCLTAIRDRALGLGDSDLFGNRTVDDWLTGGAGPSFLKWDSPKVLAALNAKLSEQGLSSIHKLDIQPDSDSDSSFAATWLLGYPHGSNANCERRISTTAPFEFNSETDARHPRHAKRVRDMATIASPTASDAEKCAA